MYPLNVTLVACQDSVQRNVLSMLINQQANLDGQYADVDAAIAALWDQTHTSRLFIVSVPDSYSLPKLRQLVGVFVGQPVLALVDAMMDPAVLLGVCVREPPRSCRYRSSPRIFGLPWSASRSSTGKPQAQNQAIAVSGVTGGCGATALAVNLAYEVAAQHGQHVILSELSLQIGKLAAYLDINPEHTTFDLLNDGERLDPQMIQRALTHVTDRFDVLAGEYRDHPDPDRRPERDPLD